MAGFMNEADNLTCVLFSDDGVEGADNTGMFLSSHTVY